MSYSLGMAKSVELSRGGDYDALLDVVEHLHATRKLSRPQTLAMMARQSPVYRRALAEMEKAERDGEE